MVRFSTRSIDINGCVYCALFNLSDEARHVEVCKGDVDPAGKKVLDIWAGADVSGMDKLSVELPAHGSVFYKIY